MGFYFRKSINFGGLRFNFSKSGMGVSTGFKGFRIGTGPRGNYVHMGRNGLYYRASLGKKDGGSNTSNRVVRQSSVPQDENLVQNNNDFFIEIDSADTTEIIDSSSEELINEINSRRKKITLKWFALLGLLLHPVIALIMLGIFAYIDYYQKTTIILYDIDEEKEKELQSFYDAFDELKNCKKKWHIISSNYTSNYKYNSGAASLLNRVPIVINNQTPKYIKTNISIPCIPVGKQKLYFFPDKILIDDGKNVGGLSYENLTIRAYNTRFIETQMKPSDGVMIDQTWRYVNKSGGPDRRFSNNYMIPIMQYTEMSFTSENGLNEEIQLSKPNVGQTLINELRNIGKKSSFETQQSKVVSKRRGVASKTSDNKNQSKTKVKSEQENIQEINDTIRKTMGNDEQKQEIFDVDEYTIPSCELLLDHFGRENSNKELLEQKKERLKEALNGFWIDISIENAIISNRVTTFEIKLLSPVKISKIVALKDNLAIALNSKSVNIAPIPENGTIGIEVQNDEFTDVFLKDVIESEEYKNNQSKDIIVLGNNTKNEIMTTSFSKSGSILISGTTGSGKSVFINTLIMGMIFKAKPNEVKMILTDLKKVELTRYNNLPHLLIPVITEKEKAISVLEWLNQEINSRFALFQKSGTKNYESYVLTNQELPRIVVIIDEFADLVGEYFAEVEMLLENVVRNGNQTGIYAVLASERPSSNIISGNIKNNIYTRIAFKVASKVDSRTILESEGAEKLFGKGDMLYITRGIDTPIRLQGAYVNDKEIDLVMKYCTQFSDFKTENVNNVQIQKIPKNEEIDNNDEKDELLEEAIELAIQMGNISASMIQRKFKIGYARAGRIIDQMEERGIVSGYDGSKPREVLITQEEWETMKDLESNINGKENTINEKSDLDSEENNYDRKSNIFYKK